MILRRIALLGLFVSTSCIFPRTTPPESEEVRTMRYRLIAAAGKTEMLRIFGDSYESNATAVFDSAEMNGVDLIAINWIRIMNRAGVEEFDRISAGTSMNAPGSLVDSGTVRIRIRAGGALRDTTLTYTTLWVLNGTHWRIRRDEIRPK